MSVIKWTVVLSDLRLSGRLEMRYLSNVYAVKYINIKPVVWTGQYFRRR